MNDLDPVFMKIRSGSDFFSEYRIWILFFSLGWDPDLVNIKAGSCAPHRVPLLVHLL